MELLQTGKEFQEPEPSFDKTSSATLRHPEKTKRRTDTNCIQTKELHKGNKRLDTNMRQIGDHSYSKNEESGAGIP